MGGYPPPGMPTWAAAKPATARPKTRVFTLDSGMFGARFRLQFFNVFRRPHRGSTALPLVSYSVIVSERSLLVVDSDPDVHTFLSGALVREGRTIQNAYDGRQALAYLRAAPFDLVLAG